MAYAINMLLAWLLQDLLQLTDHELAGAREMSIFVTFLYSEPWFRSPFVVDSAFQDLQLCKNLDRYQR